MANLLDHKTGYGAVNNLYKGFHADVSSMTDYYPFGFQMSDRTLGGSGRFGFNGQEKVDEVYGKGNLNTAEFWEYDTITTRRWNIDPIEKIAISGYSTFLGNPILYSDPLGLDTFNFNKSSWAQQSRGSLDASGNQRLGGSQSSVTINPGGENIFYYNTTHTNYDAQGNVTSRYSNQTQFFPEDPSGWNGMGKVLV